MPSIIVKAPAGNAHRKGILMMGKGLLASMQAGKQKGDHIEVVGDIRAGRYTMQYGNHPEGYFQIDLTPGVEP